MILMSQFFIFKYHFYLIFSIVIILFIPFVVIIYLYNLLCYNFICYHFCYNYFMLWFLCYDFICYNSGGPMKPKNFHGMKKFVVISIWKLWIRIDLQSLKKFKVTASKSRSSQISLFRKNSSVSWVPMGPQF